MADRDEKNDIYDYCFEGWRDYIDGAMYDTERFLGCADAEDSARAERQGRSFMSMNKIKRQINFLSGHEIKNRHILKIQPIGREDDKGCDQHTGLIMQQMGVYGGYDVLSEAFRMGALVSGGNLIEIWRDRFGCIRFGRLGFNEFLLMPDFKNPDLSDCSNILTGKYLTPDKAKALLPKKADNIDKLTENQAAFNSSRWQYLKPTMLSMDNRVLYEERYYRKSKSIDTLISNVSGQEVAYSDFIKKVGDKDIVNALMATVKLPDGRPAVERYKKPIDEVYLDVYVNDELVWNGLNPLGIDDYNHIWLHGDFIPEIDRSELKLQSYARVLREPSRLNDKRINQAVDIIETNIQSGRIMRDKYLKNPEDAYKSGQGVVLHAADNLPDGVPLNEIFHQIQNAGVSADFFKVMEILENTENQIGGLNSDALGQNDDSNMPGILSMFRTGQALTGQQGIFNGFRSSKRQLGLRLLKINQINYDPQKLKRVLNEQPSPSFYDPDFGKYDCVPTEGILTETQQNLFYLELKELRERYPDAAPIIPISALIEASPMQFKDRLADMIKQSEQRQQQAQQAAMAQQQKMDKLLEAQTIQQINKSQAELARAEEDKADAHLSRVKTMIEMQKLGTEGKMEVVDRLLRLEEITLENKKIAVSQQKIIADLVKNKNLKNRNKKRGN